MRQPDYGSTMVSNCFNFILNNKQGSTYNGRIFMKAAGAVCPTRTFHIYSGSDAKKPEYRTSARGRCRPSRIGYESPITLAKRTARHRVKKESRDDQILWKIDFSAIFCLRLTAEETSPTAIDSPGVIHLHSGERPILGPLRADSHPLFSWFCPGYRMGPGIRWTPGPIGHTSSIAAQSVKG